MDTIATRYRSLPEGRFNRRATLDRDLRPGELADAISRAKDGEDDAVRYLYLRFAPNVYGYARSILRDEHEAEDVTQQVFARLISALARYEDRGVPFSAWLLRITHNQAIDHMRRRVATAEVDERAQAPDDRRGRELGAALREALDELPPVQRKVLVLRHVSGMTPGEIAHELDRSEDAVHGLHHRGRRALQRALVERDAVPLVAA